MTTLAEYVTAFLAPFNYQKITIDIQPDNGSRSIIDTPHFKSQTILRKIYSKQGIPVDGLKAKTSHAFTLNELVSDPVVAEFIEAQEAGRAIYFMVNEGDGTPGAPPNENCRSQKNVRLLKSCFLDTDNCPIEKIDAYLEAMGIQEHIRVESSPGKFHLYFLLEDTPADLATVRTWKAIQHCIARLGQPDKVPGDYGIDASMHDYCKVLRLPGFLHQKKKEPFRSRMVALRPDLPKWNINELFAKLEANRFLYLVLDTFSNGVNGHAPAYALPLGPVKKGSQHAELLKFLGSIKHTCADREDLRRQAYGFILTSQFEDAAQFLPGGSRHQSDTIREIDYCWQAKIAEEKTLLTNIAIKSTGKEAGIRNALHLPDDVFLNLPGLAGDMIREGYAAAPYPIAPAFFATVCGFMGTFRSKYLTCRGFRSTDYYLCTAPSGSGKSFPKNMIIQLLGRLRQMQLVRSDIRSGQGLLPFLDRNKGYGYLVIDEAARLLTTIQNDRAQSYEKAILELLLKFYDLRNTPYTESETRREENRITLPHVRLNMVMFSTPDILETVFNEKSVTCGWLPRFLVFNWNGKRGTRRMVSRDGFSDSIVQQVREMLTYAGVAAETALLERESIEAEMASLPKNRVAYKELADRLAALQSESQSVSREVVLSESAARRLDAYSAETEAAYDREAAQDSSLAILHSRGYEHVCRLIPVFCNDGEAVSVETVNTLIAIVQAQIDSFINIMCDRGGMSDRQRDTEKLYDMIVRKCAASMEGWISKNDATKGVRLSSGASVIHLFNDLVGMNRVWVEAIPRAGRGGGGQKVGIVSST